MINRILDFSESPARLRVRVAQLIVQRDDLPDTTIPLADLAVVLVAHPQVTYTQAVLAGLASAGGVFVACDGRNLPVGMMLPLAAHHAQAQRFAAQARAPTPLRKRLWRQIVRAKIAAQAALLVELRGADAGLTALVPRVSSGDPSNVEARAARRYWSRLFDEPGFRRLRERRDQNVLLNYGYAVLRAIVARAVCAAGLHPSLGIHHHNRSNAFCLADDLIEPFRPKVDRAVVEYMATLKHRPGNCPNFRGETDENGGEADEMGTVPFTPAAKQNIIGELTGRYDVDGAQRTIFDAAARMAASLADVFLGNADKLELPNW